MRAGVLIIGSLLWDNQNRKVWRDSHLSLENKYQVKAPICYGRRSKNRGRTFTMTFGRNCAFGKAVLVPFSKEINSLSDMKQGACALWKAEQPNAKENVICTYWGCVGVLFHPRNEKTELRSEWQSYFNENILDPMTPVDNNGILDISWPQLSSNRQPVDIDFFMATATKAETNQPTVDEIADSWIKQNDGYECYFFNNVVHGIRTADDINIWKMIMERKPKWLGTGKYSRAEEILNTEIEQNV